MNRCRPLDKSLELADSWFIHFGVEDQAFRIVTGFGRLLAIHQVDWISFGVRDSNHMAAARCIGELMDSRAGGKLCSSIGVSLRALKRGRKLRTFPSRRTTPPRMSLRKTFSRPFWRSRRTGQRRNHDTRFDPPFVSQYTCRNLPMCQCTLSPEIMPNICEYLPWRKVVISSKLGCWYRICTSLTRRICFSGWMPHLSLQVAMDS